VPAATSRTRSPSTIDSASTRTSPSGETISRQTRG